MPPITAHAIRQLSPGKKTEGMQDSRLHSHTRSDARHSTGSISTLNRNTLYRNTRVSTLEARSAVDGERRELGGAAAAVEKAGFLAAVDPRGVGGAGTPYPFATLLADREVMDATLHDQRPSDQVTELPGNEASDLRFLKRFNKAMASECQHLWSDSMKIFTGYWMRTFSPAKKQSMQHTINARGSAWQHQPHRHHQQQIVCAHLHVHVTRFPYGS